MSYFIIQIERIFEIKLKFCEVTMKQNNHQINILMYFLSSLKDCGDNNLWMSVLFDVVN